MRCGIQLVPQDTRRDVRRQIAQLGDSQPHLAIADDRCLAGSTGEHHIAAPANSDKGRKRCADLGGIDIRTIAGPAPPRRHPVMIISHVASMAGCPEAPCQSAGTRHRSAVAVASLRRTRAG